MLDFSYFCGCMEIKSKAIVLRMVKYGDGQAIVDLFTRERGRTSFICRLPKGGRSKVKVQFFQPLSLLEVVYDDRTTRNLQRFRDIRLSQPFFSIPFHPDKVALALFVAEFLCYALRDEQRDEPLYDYVESSVAWLDNVEERYANFHLVFMLRLSRFIGFFPNLTDADRGEWFDLRNGLFTPTRPLHGDYLAPEEASKIKGLMRMTFENMRFFRMNSDERNRCTDIILYYYRLHVPNFPELKSLPVLRELF